MTDLAEHFKKYVNEKHLSGAPREETRLLLDVWEVMLSVRRNSLTEEPSQKFRASYPRKPVVRHPRPIVSFERSLHKVLSVCLDQPLNTSQISGRCQTRWGVLFNAGQLMSYLHRLYKNGFLDRVSWGQYCLTDLGRQRLSELESPPPLSPGGPAAVLIRSLLEETYQPKPGEFLATYSAEALERALELLETA